MPSEWFALHLDSGTVAGSDGKCVRLEALGAHSACADDIFTKSLNVYAELFGNMVVGGHALKPRTCQLVPTDALLLRRVAS